MYATVDVVRSVEAAALDNYGPEDEPLDISFIIAPDLSATASSTDGDAFVRLAEAGAASRIANCIYYDHY